MVIRIGKLRLPILIAILIFLFFSYILLLQEKLEDSINIQKVLIKISIIILSFSPYGLVLKIQKPFNFVEDDNN